jgi:transcription factor IIIB 90 kDa subunit
LKKDWISTGRRPDGVCAVAILIASRCHGFHKTQVEITKLFRISSKTLLDRIDDFRATPSAQLTVEQFHLHDFDAEYDPPAYTRGTKDNGATGAGSDDESDDSDAENKNEVTTVDGVKVRKVVIKGLEVNVPLPQAKKKR